DLARLVRLDVRPQPLRAAGHLQAQVEVLADQVLVEQQGGAEDGGGIADGVGRVHGDLARGGRVRGLPWGVCSAHYTSTRGGRRRRVSWPPLGARGGGGGAGALVRHNLAREEWDPTGGLPPRRSPGPLPLTVRCSMRTLRDLQQEFPISPENGLALEAAAKS